MLCSLYPQCLGWTWLCCLRLLKGTGPEEGWVSTKISGKDLVALLPEPVPADAVGPTSGVQHRWAVDIDAWSPAGLRWKSEDWAMRTKYMEFLLLLLAIWKAPSNVHQQERIQ